MYTKLTHNMFTHIYIFFRMSRVEILRTLNCKKLNNSVRFRKQKRHNYYSINRTKYSIFCCKEHTHASKRYHNKNIQQGYGI